MLESCFERPDIFAVIKIPLHLLRGSQRDRIRQSRSTRHYITISQPPLPEFLPSFIMLGLVVSLSLFELIKVVSCRAIESNRLFVRLSYNDMNLVCTRLLRPFV